MFRAIYFQLLATVIVAALAGTFVGWRGAVSAALGGAATMLPNFLFALRLAIAARKPGGPGVAAFFIGEFVKVAGAAATIMPSVYGAGVRGHDHVGDFPGGADYNDAWEPVLVLFTNSAAANQHLVTDTQIEDAVANHDAIEVPVAALTFHCSWAPVTLWNMATPIATD